MPAAFSSPRSGAPLTTKSLRNADLGRLTATTRRSKATPAANSERREQQLRAALATALLLRAAALSPDVLGSMYEMAVAGSDDGMVNFAQFLWLCLSIKKSCVLASSGVAVMPKKARVRDMLRLGGDAPVDALR